MGKRYLFAIRHLWQDVLVDDGELDSMMPALVFAAAHPDLYED